MIKQNFFKSLRFTLLVWYIGSLTILATFFTYVIHIFALPYGFELFILLLFTLAIIGSVIIYKITKSLVYVSDRMKTITTKNLDERILDIKGKHEIAELANSFNNLLDRLHEAFERERQFIADVAHELKTPLATLRSSIEITLLKERSSERYRKTLEEALVDTNHLSSTLKNVLDLAWSETPAERKNMDNFNLSEIVIDLCDIAEKMTHKKQILIVQHIDKDINMKGYKDKIANAIMNIIDNAIKYSPQEGIIKISLVRNSDRAVLTIEDNGPGIAKKDLLNIFDRFYRGSSTDKVFGSGLGLAISRSLIKLHGGSIEAESKIGNGAKFIITLPLSK